MAGQQVRINSSKALILAAAGLIYLYFTLSFRCVLSGLPLLIGLVIQYIMENETASQYSYLTGGALVILNISYWISSTSFVLYPIFTISTWLSVTVIAFWRYDSLYARLRPIKDLTVREIARFETKVANFRWPLLDFDGQGILALTGASLVLSQMTFTITGIDFSFEVDADTKIVAKIETIRIRLCRDISIGDVFLNIRGDGTPASEHKSFTPVSRAGTTSSVASGSSGIQAEGQSIRTSGSPSPLRKLPPAPSGNGEVTAPKLLKRDPSVSNTAPPPPLPPRLPPRTEVAEVETASGNSSSSITANEDEQEREDLRRAIEASLEQPLLDPNSLQTEFVGTSDFHARQLGHSSCSSSSSLPRTASLDPPGGSVDAPPSENQFFSAASAESSDPVTSHFYPKTDETDSETLKAVFDEGAIHHSSTNDAPEFNESDTKAAIAASLQDQTAYHKSLPRERRIKLSDIVAKIPWFLKIAPGPLVTRLILSPIVWLHPLSIATVAATGTGKRITNLMETSGLKKAHPNQEIFRLIRKVFLWLEAGAISLVLENISIRPHIPLSAEHDVRIEIKASEPTAYRNTHTLDRLKHSESHSSSATASQSISRSSSLTEKVGGVGGESTGRDDNDDNKDDGGKDQILAKIHAISTTFHLPAYLLPNHTSLIPTTQGPRGTIPFDVLLSLPGVFNGELLTIGAAFVKATTMMDLKHTAQSRPGPVLPYTHHHSSNTTAGAGRGGHFSFKSLGLAMRQAAGDLAKQKGVEWGIRDAELAKWTAKLARWMRVIKVDVGAKGEIPLDLYRLKLRARLGGKKGEE